MAFRNDDWQESPKGELNAMRYFLTKGRVRAFSLSELLVALGLIAILALLLLPVVNQAMQSSKASKCISQLRDLGRIALQYSADHNNNLVPYRIDPGGNPSGLWYDHLHEYIGRARGKAGRDINGVRVPVEQWQCPISKRQYNINQICGWTDGTRTIPKTYLKLGQGCIDNISIFQLPGGLSKTAFFADASTTGSCFKPENYTSTNDFIGWSHRNKANIVFMDGHVEAIENPDFVNNPKVIDQERWIFLFGRKKS